MRDVISGKLSIPDFSDRLADYEEDRAKFAAVKDEYDGIRYQTDYVNKLGTVIRRNKTPPSRGFRPKKGLIPAFSLFKGFQF